MKPINLLPEDYVIGRRRRLRRRNTLAFAIASCCLMLTWAGIVIMQKRSIGHRLFEAKQTLAALDETWDRIEVQGELVAQRQAQLAELQRVRDVLPWPAVLALLARDFPQEGALSNLMIYVPDAAVPAARPMAQGTSRSGRSAAGDSVFGPLQARDDGQAGQHVRVEMEGVTASDVVVAAYARKLSETGVFEQVRIEDAKPVTIHQQPMHQFKLSAKIVIASLPAQLSQARRQ